MKFVFFTPISCTREMHLQFLMRPSRTCPTRRNSRHFFAANYQFISHFLSTRVCFFTDNTSVSIWNCLSASWFPSAFPLINFASHISENYCLSARQNKRRLAFSEKKRGSLAGKSNDWSHRSRWTKDAKPIFPHAFDGRQAIGGEVTTVSWTPPPDCSTTTRPGDLDLFRLWCMEILCSLACVILKRINSYLYSRDCVVMSILSVGNFR